MIAYFKYTSGSTFTLSGEAYKGFFFVDEGVAYAGKDTSITSQPLSSTKTFRADSYLKQFEFDRTITNVSANHTLEKPDISPRSVLSDVAYQRNLDMLHTNNVKLFGLGVLANSNIIDFGAAPSNAAGSGFLGLSSGTTDIRNDDTVLFKNNTEPIHIEPYSMTENVPAVVDLDDIVSGDIIIGDNGDTFYYFVTTSTESLVLSGSMSRGSSLREVNSFIPNTDKFHYDSFDKKLWTYTYVNDDLTITIYDISLYESCQTAQVYDRQLITIKGADITTLRTGRRLKGIIADKPPQVEIVQPCVVDVKEPEISCIPIVMYIEEPKEDFTDSALPYMRGGGGRDEDGRLTTYWHKSRYYCTDAKGRRRQVINTLDGAGGTCPGGSEPEPAALVYGSSGQIGGLRTIDPSKDWYLPKSASVIIDAQAKIAGGKDTHAFRAWMNRYIEIDEESDDLLPRSSFSPKLDVTGKVNKRILDDNVLCVENYIAEERSLSTAVPAIGYPISHPVGSDKPGVLVDEGLRPFRHSTVLDTGVEGDYSWMPENAAVWTRDFRRAVERHLDAEYGDAGDFGRRDGEAYESLRPEQKERAFPYIPDPSKPWREVGMSSNSTVTILTEAPGYSTEEVDALITMPLKNALNGVTDVFVDSAELAEINAMGDLFGSPKSSAEYAEFVKRLSEQTAELQLSEGEAAELARINKEIEAPPLVDPAWAHHCAGVEDSEVVDVSGGHGVTRIRTTSDVSLSLIFVEFDWDTDIEQARKFVQDRIDVMMAEGVSEGYYRSNGSTFASRKMLTLPDCITPLIAPVMHRIPITESAGVEILDEWRGQRRTWSAEPYRNMMPCHEVDSYKLSMSWVAPQIVEHVQAPMPEVLRTHLQIPKPRVVYAGGMDQPSHKDESGRHILTHGEESRARAKRIAAGPSTAAGRASVGLNQAFPPGQGMVAPGGHGVGYTASGQRFNLGSPQVGGVGAGPAYSRGWKSMSKAYSRGMSSKTKSSSDATFAAIGASKRGPQSDRALAKWHAEQAIVAKWNAATSAERLDPANWPRSFKIGAKDGATAEQLVPDKTKRGRWVVTKVPMPSVEWFLARSDQTADSFQVLHDAGFVRAGDTAVGGPYLHPGTVVDGEFQLPIAPRLDSSWIAHAKSLPEFDTEPPVVEPYSICIYHKDSSKIFKKFTQLEFNDEAILGFDIRAEDDSMIVMTFVSDHYLNMYHIDLSGDGIVPSPTLVTRFQDSGRVSRDSAEYHYPSMENDEFSVSFSADDSNVFTIIDRGFITTQFISNPEYPSGFLRRSNLMFPPDLLFSDTVEKFGKIQMKFNTNSLKSNYYNFKNIATANSGGNRYVLYQNIGRIYFKKLTTSTSYKSGIPLDLPYNYTVNAASCKSSIGLVINTDIQELITDTISILVNSNVKVLAGLVEGIPMLSKYVVGDTIEIDPTNFFMYSNENLNYLTVSRMFDQIYSLQETVYNNII